MQALTRAMAVVSIGCWAAAIGQWLLRRGFQVAVPGIAVHRHCETVCFIMVWHETAARRRGGDMMRRRDAAHGGAAELQIQPLR